MTLIDYKKLFETTDDFKSLIPLFYESIIPEYNKFDFSKINKNTMFFYTHFDKNIYLKKIIAFINDLKKHEHESYMFNVCILDILNCFDDEFKFFSNDNLAILQGYTNNKNHKNILSEQLPQHQKFIKEYIQFHTNLKQETNSTKISTIVKDNDVNTLNSKYPYINSLVHNLNDVNLNEYCLNVLDLKTWLGFFACYINTCNHLNSKGMELSEENITKKMKEDFYHKKNSQYIDFINNLEIKLSKTLK
jgi:hypothetical protein